MRTRSPRSAPPVKGLVGSTAMMPTVRPAAAVRSARGRAPACSCPSRAARSTPITKAPTGRGIEPRRPARPPRERRPRAARARGRASATRGRGCPRPSRSSPTRCDGILSAGRRGDGARSGRGDRRRGAGDPARRPSLRAGVVVGQDLFVGVPAPRHRDRAELTEPDAVTAAAPFEHPAAMPAPRTPRRRSNQVSGVPSVQRTASPSSTTVSLALAEEPQLADATGRAARHHLEVAQRRSRDRACAIERRSSSSRRKTVHGAGGRRSVRRRLRGRSRSRAAARRSTSGAADLPARARAPRREARRRRARRWRPWARARGGDAASPALTSKPSAP